MDRDTYDRIDALNFSRLKAMEDCPAVFWHGMQNVEKDKDAFRLGRAFHTATLEPDEWDARFAVWTGGNKTKARAKWEEFQENHSNHDILTPAEADQARKMAQSVRQNRVLGPMVRGGESELAVTWRHEGRVTADLKGMLDHVTLAKDAILDLKSTLHPDPRRFGSDAFRYLYFVQAAMYVDGYAATHGGVMLPYYIGAVGKPAPHVAQAYQVTDAQLQMGRETYERWLDLYVGCKAAGHFGGYAVGALELELPAWAMDEDETDVADDFHVPTKEA
jgi:hypothetical protein